MIAHSHRRQRHGLNLGAIEEFAQLKALAASLMAGDLRHPDARPARVAALHHLFSRLTLLAFSKSGDATFLPLLRLAFHSQAQCTKVMQSLAKSPNATPTPTATTPPLPDSRQTQFVRRNSIDTTPQTQFVWRNLRTPTPHLGPINSSNPEPSGARQIAEGDPEGSGGGSPNQTLKP